MINSVNYVFVRCLQFGVSGLVSPARENDLYRLVGLVIAWPPHLDDIPDQDLKQKIIQASLTFN